MRDLYKQIQEVTVKQTLLEKKEAIATSVNTNMTMHYNSDFQEVAADGGSEFIFTLSISSTGGKEYYRAVADQDESDKLSEAARLELRRAVRKFDKYVELIVQKYKLQAR